MIYHRRKLLIVVPMLLAFCFSSGIAYADGSGLVTIIKGEANKRSVAGHWQGLKEQEQVVTGERIRTLKKSLAEILIHNSQKIRMGPETTVDFQNVFADEEKTVSKLDLMEGDIWAEMDKLDADSSFEVSSKLAHATVRGTVFSLHAGSDGAVLNVYRGAVEVAGRQPAKSGLYKPREMTAPEEIDGPREVAGPKEVSLKEWIQIVHAMQQIVISNDGLWQVRDIGQRELQQVQWKKWSKMLQHR